MGGASSAPSPGYPPEWAAGATADARAAGLEKLRAVAEMDVRAFMEVVTPLPALEKQSWNFDSFIEHAEAALGNYRQLQKKVDRLVPKHLPEEEFWRLYFCHVHAALAPGRPPPSLAQLAAQDDTTSNAIISAFEMDPLFQKLSRKEMEGILQRDKEDDDKLAAGIAKAVAKGVIPKDPPVEETLVIDVLGKSADDVAAAIIEKLGDAPQSGCVLVLQGLSGTGKGTTVAKLQKALPQAVCWSNGNVFRSLTLLAVSHCEQNGLKFCSEILTPDLLQKLVECLTFGKFDGRFDIQIKGYGYDVLVSQVANTTLKEPRVGKNIPTVAEVTQGEVIMFAGAAAEAMRKDGMNVLMEGRAQTLNYVRTPHRFELTLSQPLIIGMRRAAQRMMGQALESFKDKANAMPDEVYAGLAQALASMETPDGILAAACKLSKALVDAADDTTSNAIITVFEGNPTFLAFAKKEMEAILQRDKEDDEKLAAGIAKAVAKGVISKDPPVEPTCIIDVLGKSADEVAAAILEKLGTAPNAGCVLVLQGLSGTGKGTTVSKLQAALPRAVSWSNGNLFRTLTLLAVGHCEQKGIPFSGDVLTPGLLQQCIDCLTFGKFDGKWDIEVKAPGLDKALVSEIANTVLKEPRVGKNIPTVAEVTQGEVIKFAAAAAEAMQQDGMNVLMEGRAQTLNYVRTPHRFQLTLREPIIIGKRRAAQRMAAKAAELMKGNKTQWSSTEVYATLTQALESMTGSEKPSSGTPAVLSKALLELGDDSTSNAIIAAFRQNAAFEALSKKEMDGILQRDAEDDSKLAAGIAKAIEKGVIPADPPVEPICSIDVLGKTADAVASAIVEKLGAAPKTGCVLVLQGLSGTGKGTTVAKLQALLPRAVCWSNGNVFRSLTLLAVAHCEQKGIAFRPEILTPELLKQLVSCLTFGKFDGKFDIRINGYGFDVLVSKVANTTLKEPQVGKNIPTVAEVTQGEVIMFAGGAAELMRKDGMNVLMEGRAQTLNYVRTPHRFELTLAQPIIIGMRRAAQRMMGKALDKLKEASNPSSEDVHAALQDALSGMA